MTLYAPQIILTAWILLGSGAAIARHGQPNTGNQNAFIPVSASAGVFALLWWGGFFG